MNHRKINKVVFTGPGSILPVDRTLKKIKAPDSLRLRDPLVTNADGNKKMNNHRIDIINWVARVSGRKLAGEDEMDAYFYNLNNELNKSTFCDISNAKNGAPGVSYYSHIMTLNSFPDIQDNKNNLKNCNFPVLIMRGQCDNQPWGFTTEYLKLFPDTRLRIISGAGHSIAAEQPELYLKTILGFLQE